MDTNFTTADSEFSVAALVERLKGRVRPPPDPAWDPMDYHVVRCVIDSFEIKSRLKLGGVPGCSTRVMGLLHGTITSRAYPVPSVGCEAYIRDCWERAIDLVAQALSLGRALGFEISERINQEARVAQFEWFLIELAGKLTSSVKYHLNWLFVKAFSNPYNEFPERSGKVVGEEGSWCRVPSLERLVRRDMMSRSHVRRRYFVCNTILQGFKKGLLPISDLEILDSLEGHKKRLTQQGVTPPEILDNLEDVIDELYPRKAGLEVTDLTRLSVSGCWERGRAGKGTYGHLVCRFFSQDEKLEKSHHLPLMDLWLSRDDLAGYRGGLAPVELRTKGPTVTELSDDFFIEGVRRTGEPVKAMVALVLEPLKARVISKGEASAYAFLQPLQKWAWKELADHPTFQLVGRPCDDDIVQRLARGWKPGMWWVSGDYEASTDNFNQDVSLFATKQLFGRTGLVGNHLAMAAMAGHEVHYDGAFFRKVGSRREEDFTGRQRYFFNEIRDRLPEPFVQVHGQLMGSPISFPILCLVNLAVFRAAYRKRFPQWRGRISDLPVIINGDDIAFVGDLDLIRIWQDLVPRAGLKPSLGKNFVSKEFVQINSEFYPVRTCKTKALKRAGEIIIPGTTIARVQPKVGYANLGLITGRVKGEKFLASMEDLTLEKRVSNLYNCGAQVQEKLLESLNEQEKVGVWREFLRQNKQPLLQLGLSWYAPKTSGGYGFSTVEMPFNIAEAPEQTRRLARALVSKRMPKGIREESIASALVDQTSKFSGYLGRIYDLIPNEECNIWAFRRGVDRLIRKFKPSSNPEADVASCAVRSVLENSTSRQIPDFVAGYSTNVLVRVVGPWKGQPEEPEEVVLSGRPI